MNGVDETVADSCGARALVGSQLALIRRNYYLFEEVNDPAEL